MPFTVPRPFLTLLSCALLLSSVAVAQGPNGATDLGTLTPTFRYQRSKIAIPAFGKAGTAPVEWDTVPRIIRNDLSLTGFFDTAPEMQQQVTRQNLYEVNQQIAPEWAKWSEMGFEMLLMGMVTSPGPGKIQVEVRLYDTASGTALLLKSFAGPQGALRDLAHTASDAVVEATKSTQGIARTRLTFVMEQIPGVKEIALMDADGFNMRAITQYGNVCTMPTWGARGEEVYYTSYHGRQARIWGQSLTANQSWVIAGYGGTNQGAKWCPANQRLVMVLSKDGNNELYTSDRSGQDLRRLTQTSTVESSPTWSPDGSRIAYVSNESGNPQIYVMNADGGGKRRLTTRGGWNDAPSWSPDGQRLAFTSRTGGSNDIFIMDASGAAGSYRRLTQGQGNNESPSWAPNSRHLTFASDRSGQWQVYLMLDDGSNQRALTATGRNTQPDWGPLAK